MLAKKTGRELSNDTECDKDWKRGGVLWGAHGRRANLVREGRMVKGSLLIS